MPSSRSTFHGSPPAADRSVAAAGDSAAALDSLAALEPTGAETILTGHGDRSCADAAAALKSRTRARPS
jgi:hypothetical protein